MTNFIGQSTSTDAQGNAVMSEHFAQCCMPACARMGAGRIMGCFNENAVMSEHFAQKSVWAAMDTSI